MKSYYYLKDSTGIIQPIAYKHEDGTVSYFNTQLGCISFAGTMKGDTIKMYNGEVYEGTCDVLDVFNINGTIKLTLSDPRQEPDSVYLHQKLQNDLDHYRRRQEDYIEKRESFISQAESADKMAVDCRMKIDEILRLAGLHNIILK